MHVGAVGRRPAAEHPRVGRQLGRNTCTVHAAYTALEREALVEVRGRSGVFVARQDDETSEETARWLRGVLADHRGLAARADSGTRRRRDPPAFVYARLLPGGGRSALRIIAWAGPG